MLCSLLNFFSQNYTEYNWLIKEINIEEGPPAIQYHTQLVSLTAQLTLDGKEGNLLLSRHARHFTHIITSNPETTPGDGHYYLPPPSFIGI